MKNPILITVAIVCAVSVLLNAYLLTIGNTQKGLNLGKNNTNVGKNPSNYPYLAKRIFAENFSDILINFLELRTDLRNITEPNGDKFSLYFEYLPTGVSININGTTEFHQASLFKVPVVMSYYHQRERLRDPGDPVLTIQKEDLDDEFGDLWKKGVGYKIKMSEAIRLALAESDNTAIKMIVPRITKQDFDDVYSSLDIDLNTDSSGAVITTKGYSSILKALYFSSVLEPEDSQHILNILTKTKFVDKLPAGVPQNISVAHKIGVFNKGKDTPEAYMDCGIVYIPNRPYSLCMYVESDEQTARERMRIISKKVYDYVSTVAK